MNGESGPLMVARLRYGCASTLPAQIQAQIPSEGNHFMELFAVQANRMQGASTRFSPDLRKRGLIPSRSMVGAQQVF